MKRVVGDMMGRWHNKCLFCGEEMLTIEGRYGELSYECHCEDALLEQELLKEIEEIRKRIPEERFYFTTELIFNKKGESKNMQATAR